MTIMTMPAPTRRARQRCHDWIEQALIDWAQWVHTYLDGAGFGGGLDNPKTPGRGSSVANPVLSEVIATDIAGHGQNQRVHRHLLRYAREFNPEWLQVAWVRYVGMPVPTSTKVIRTESDHGWMEIGDGVRVPFVMPSTRIEVGRTFRWSGMVDWESLARSLGIKQRTAEGMLSSVKEELAMDLRADVYVLTGRVLPDGKMSDAEVATAIAVQLRRLEVKHQREEEAYLKSCG